MTKPASPLRSAASALFLMFACSPQSAVAQPSSVPSAAPARPALWRVADADTTIFLFGTVHALPGGPEWLTGTIAGALLSSDALVTEVVPRTLTDPGFIARYGAAARLPEGETLRALLNPDQRAKYEAALATLKIDPAALDAYKPWFVANTLVLAPLLAKGFSANAGSENAIEAKVPATTPRIGLETGDQQIALFDGIPREVQIANLMQVADQLGTVDRRIERTVTAWLAGDVGTVAAESESKNDDPRMAEALLYPRNWAWADWIAARLAMPGRVFIAVGAGHLAGPRSVQAALEAKGIKVTRLQ